MKKRYYKLLAFLKTVIFSTNFITYLFAISFVNVIEKYILRWMHLEHHVLKLIIFEKKRDLYIYLPLGSNILFLFLPKYILKIINDNYNALFPFQNCNFVLDCVNMLFYYFGLLYMGQYSNIGIIHEINLSIILVFIYMCVCTTGKRNKLMTKRWKRSIMAKNLTH